MNQVFNLEKTAADGAEDAGPLRESKRFAGFRKLLVLAAVVAAFGFVFTRYGGELSLTTLSQKEDYFRQYQQEHPVLVFVAALLIYVAVTSLSLPGAAGLTLAYGWFFGFGRGVILVSFASTAGATIAFLLSRYLLRDTIQNKFGDRLAGFNKALEREGAFYLFTLRLIPVMPFFVINLVMGLTRMRVGTFCWVSQVGMLAGTCVFVYAGDQLPSLQELADKGVGGVLSPQLIAAFVLLGIFPIAVKKISERIRVPKIKIPACH